MIFGDGLLVAHQHATPQQHITEAKAWDTITTNKAVKDKALYHTTSLKV